MYCKVCSTSSGTKLGDRSEWRAIPYSDDSAFGRITCDALRQKIVLPYLIHEDEDTDSSMTEALKEPSAV